MEVKKEYKSKIIKLNREKTKCPICKKQFLSSYAPFCSKKCSDIDLINWLSDENYINLNSNR